MAAAVPPGYLSVGRYNSRSEFSSLESIARGRVAAVHVAGWPWPPLCTMPDPPVVVRGDVYTLGVEPTGSAAVPTAEVGRVVDLRRRGGELQRPEGVHHHRQLVGPAWPLQ